MKIGIVGLPNVGKSTLFNSITKAGAECANYPFCTIEPNVGVVAVPDERIDKLAEIYNPKKVTKAVVEFVDIAGLVKGASKGEGLGNKFLSHIRETDSILQVVRCFEDSNITHVDGSIDPVRDIETITLELIFADLETIEKRIDRAVKLLKGDKKYQFELDTLNKVKAALDAGKPARTLDYSEEELEVLHDCFLLTMKPVMYVANISEDEVANPDANANVQRVKEYAKAENAEVIPLCVKIEEELSALDEADEKEMLEALGIEESGLDKLIKASYKLLGLISYLTAGEPEVRAWTIKEGTKAPQAAGKIHTDFERGFIKADVISYEDLINKADGSMVTAREKGLVRSEGKEYVMKDGDIVLFKFNV
jgi:GTP-binding protein YchF